MRHHSHGLRFPAIATALLVTVAAPRAIAVPCISDVNNLIPAGCVYEGAGPIQFQAGAATVVLRDLRLRDMSIGLPPSLDSFFDVFVEVELPPLTHGALGGLGSFTFAHPGGSPILPSDPLPLVPAVIDIEILSLELTAVPFMLRESPTLPSLGQAWAEDLGGGQFRIDSFFDIFTELSLDGGQSWLPSAGPTHMQLRQGVHIPEPAGMLVLALGLLAVGVSLRRRA